MLFAKGSVSYLTDHEENLSSTSTLTKPLPWGSSSLSTTVDNAKIAWVDNGLNGGDVDLWAGVSDGSFVTSLKILATIQTNLDLLDLTNLEHGFLGGDSVNR